MNTTPMKPATGRVLQDTSKPAMTDKQRIQQLEAELNATKAKLATKKQLRCKVSAKGAISLYGLNARFPVTLYYNQWEQIATVLPSILQFGKDNADKLSKPDGDDA